MLENFLPTNIIAIGVVSASVILLVYFAVKTLITANLFQQGTNLYQAEDYQGAEAAFRKVIAINSTNDVVRLLLGDTLSKQGNHTEAIALFREVINRSPKNPQAYLRLANILMQQEQTEEAQINLKQARDLLMKQRQPETAKRLSVLLDKMDAKAKVK
ncbi:tetratricopeptide TPR_2 repeat protein [Richelia sinica FACHB-800]|uniref:Tetratricopeptide TPR_2 repeat protein n=1 Tax=Richelia sinica FACHB-800 TaxID=1357546 RepID=A0A975T5A1_9NOST|nr:tetratricopeptide repeat protein [Richelia sinica]MBD2662890.1 tetratricopeptide repeat protein [Richelia sinica FACHB-800]QXE21728.1 tetratricopeptide TPR_2 repeat protein [Richelia sinica FACHB-800]